MLQFNNELWAVIEDLWKKNEERREVQFGRKKDVTIEVQFERIIKKEKIKESLKFMAN